MSSEFKQLLKERKLIRISPNRKMVLKELSGAEKDLEDAKDSFKQKKFKWATIQAYYCMFHGARALLYTCGFREKSHYAILVALRELFPNKLGNSLINNFEFGMELRQEADYGLKFSEEGAIETVESAEKFLEKVKELLKVR